MNRIGRVFSSVVLSALVLAGMPVAGFAQAPSRAVDASYQQGYDQGYQAGHARGVKAQQSGKYRNASDFKQLKRAGGSTTGDPMFDQGFRDGFQQGFGDGLGGLANAAAGGPSSGSSYPGYGAPPPNDRAVLSRGRGPADAPPPVATAPYPNAAPYGNRYPGGGTYTPGPPVLRRPGANGGYGPQTYPGVGGYPSGRRYGNIGGYGAGRLAYNTTLVIELTTPLSSKNSHEGQPFSAVVVSPGQYAGSRVEGQIGRIDRAGRFAGKAEMTLIFQGIIYPDGYAEPMQAQVTDVIGYRGSYANGPWGWNGSNSSHNKDANAKAGDEGQIVGESSYGRDIAIVGASTATGAVLGRVLGGGTWVGAAIGAAAGGGIVALNRGRDIELDPGVQLQIQTGQGVRF